MGILTKLTTEGSILSAHDGNNPPINPLATQQSKLHADGNAPGYSLDGTQAVLVTNQYNAYLDGVGNQIPQPSLLDTNGAIPPFTPGGGQALPYLDNLPQ
jgi:hypothetical protein